jgi:hypothetical protein
MAHKYIGDLLVLDTRVGGDVPKGQIELKVRRGHGKPFRQRMALADYRRQLVFKRPPRSAKRAGNSV